MEIRLIKDTFRLRNGVEIPCLGFGTFKTPEGEATVNSVKEAIEAGYRLIDTAAVYQNEKSVGKAIREGGVKRNELFVTSKLWNSEQGFDSTLRAFDATMKNLALDYLDLYLIHWPIAQGHDKDWPLMVRETWRAMEQLSGQGRIRAIGVSNFKANHLDSLLQEAVILPMVDQIEIHPGLNQDPTVSYCKEHDIQVEAWGPLAQGALFRSDVLDNLAAKYNKTVAQISLRWILQRGIIPLPKSVTPSRIRENAEIFDFELSPDDMEYISELPTTGTKADPDVFRA